ncbi:MAG: twin-arginine translocase TatA/TatE family subunit [Anaerolineae bacterium]|jgi:sec-independent protein translocase protein TatB|nr:twin-arginine translocase TatA/TatE family subunit [Anaerolineae bacterium]MDX9829169.1 twin-arginine translocase TatA/TatE family subunit [Anaerolineae bacterium]
MNIFSNIGITELIVILLLALLVVGPERLPEMGRKLAKTLRDVRQMYENLTKDLGPELMSLQQTTRELRESVESVRTIPKDMVDSVVKAADLDDTVSDLKSLTDDLDQMGKSLTQAKKVIQNPMQAAVKEAREVMTPPKAEPAEPSDGKKAETASAETIASADSVEDVKNAESAESVESVEGAEVVESAESAEIVESDVGERTDD